MDFVFNNNISSVNRNEVFLSYKKWLNNYLFDKMKINNAFFVFDETISNIIDYYEANLINGKCYILVSITNESINFIIKNNILHISTPTLVSYLNQINNSTDEALKRLIKLNLLHNESGVKNAGIGLIMIRIKINNSINYTIKSLNNEFDEITLSLKLKL